MGSSSRRSIIRRRRMRKGMGSSSRRIIKRRRRMK